MNLQNALPRSLASLLLPQIFREVYPKMTHALYRRQKHRRDGRRALLASGTGLDIHHCGRHTLAAFGYTATWSAIKQDVDDVLLMRGYVFGFWHRRVLVQGNQT